MLAEQSQTLTGRVAVLDNTETRDLATGAQLSGLAGNPKLLAVSGPIADAITSGTDYPAFAVSTPTGVQIFIINTAPSP